MERKRNLEVLESQSGNGKSKQVDDPEIEGLISFFEHLPDCIIFNILLRLPMKGVLVCRCVCKSWRTLISGAEFAELHLKHAQVDVLIRTNDPKCVSRTLHLLDFEPEMFAEHNPFCSCDFKSSSKLICKSHMKLEAKFRLPLRDAKMVLEKRIEAKSGCRNRRYIPCKPRDDKLGVVNSCNGLLCLCNPRDQNALVVCNPITEEFVRLPKPINVKRRMWPFVCGFGFHPRTNEYKVIRLYRKYTKANGAWMDDGMVAEMHTLGTQIWRVVGKPPDLSSMPQFPTCVNGALNWLTFDDALDDDDELADDITMILSFSFESEMFQSFPCPECFCSEDIYKWRSSENIILGEYRGCIYLCNGVFGLEFWVMKEYGVAESWTKLFCIDIEEFPPGLYLPIKFYGAGAVLMYHSCNGLLYCKLGEFYGSDFKYFKIYGTRYTFEAIAHIPSLLSLKDALKNTNVEVLNVVSRCGAFKLREENETLYLAQEDIDLAWLFTRSGSESDEYDSEEWNSY